MPSQRVIVDEGIYRDRFGYDVRLKVSGKQRTKRFALETPLSVMQLWRAEQKTELLKLVVAGRLEATPVMRGTLAAEAPRYLSQIAGRTSFKSDQSHLGAWIALYGAQTMPQVTTEHVNNAISKWQAEGYSAQTVIHRKRVLREMYQMLYGRKTKHPVEDARRISKPLPQAVNVPDEITEAVDAKFRAMNLPVEYAIFRVLVTTGQRPCQVNRARRIDVNLKKGVWMVPPAKGEKAHPIYLSDDMIAAWQLFIDADAWGKVDTCHQARLMRRCGWPKDIRPYNMRHSFAFSAMERGADIGDLQLMLGHHQIETTRQSYARGQEDRMRRVSQLLNGRFNRPSLKLVR